MILDWILNILSIVFVFVAIGFCIFSHELGHFLAAKWRGLHIDAFSLGFKPFWRKKINGVEYRLGWLPFGGYVELPQVDATDAIPKAADGTELPRAKPLDRIITAVAGPLFNILSGLLIGCFVWWIGIPQDSPKMRELSVLTVDQSGPEWAAGLRPGDKIVRINGEPFFATWKEVILNKILLTVGEVTFDVERDGKIIHIAYVPAENPNAPSQLRAEGIAWPFFTVLVPIVIYPEAGSPAEQAGIEPGDVVIAVDGKPLSEFLEYQSAIDLAGSRGLPVRLTLLRGEKKLELAVQPKAIPELANEENTAYLIGINFDVAKNGNKPLVGSLISGYPAEAAGVQPGDKLLKVNGVSVSSNVEFKQLITKNKKAKAVIELERNGEKHELAIEPIVCTPQTIGAEIEMLDHPTPFQQLGNTVEMTRKSLVGILVGLGNKLGLTEQTSSLKPSHMSGVLGMGTVLFTSVRHASIMSAIYFLVIISFALAIFNLFPLPVLDGGHIMFGLIEIIFRKPLPTVIIKGLSMVFVVLLIGLMVYVTFSDGRRLLRQTHLLPIKTEAPEKNLPEPETDSGQPQTEENHGTTAQ